MIFVFKKNFYKALLIFLFVCLFYITLPHQDIPLIEYLLPPIRFKSDSVLFIQVIPFILSFIWLYRGIVKSTRLHIASKFIIFLVLLLLAPNIVNTLGYVKQPYYYFSQGLKSVDILTCDVSPNKSVVEETLKLNFVIKNYGPTSQEFTVSLILPENMDTPLISNISTAQKTYTLGSGERRRIEETFLFQYSKPSTENAGTIYDSLGIHGAYKILLENNKDALEILCHR